MGRKPLNPTGPMTATERSLKRYAKHRDAINRKRREVYKRGKNGRRLSPASNGPDHDLIMTPPELAQEVVDAFQPTGRLLDPCRGAGAFYEALKRHSDAVDWCELSEGRDFLAYREPRDWIISNPPWSKLRAFLRHAMTLAPNIVFLATLVHLTTKARLRDMQEAGFGIARILPVPTPPPPWPGGGFQLAAVHLRKGAPSLFG